MYLIRVKTVKRKNTLFTPILDFQFSIVSTRRDKDKDKERIETTQRPVAQVSTQ